MSSAEEPLPPFSRPDLTSFHGEWPMLLECASPAVDSQRLGELARSVDWSRLLVLAQSNTGSSGISRSVSRELDENLVPADIRQTLLERHLAQVFSTLRMTAELFRLLELFAAKDIPALVVKGPVLAMQAYGDPADAQLRRSRLARPPARHPSRHGSRCWPQVTRQPFPLSAIDAGKIPGQYLFTKPQRKIARRTAQRFHATLLSPPPASRKVFRAAHSRAPGYPRNSCPGGRRRTGLHLYSRCKTSLGALAAGLRMSPRWSPGNRASIGRALRRQPRKWERSACCIPACAWLRICCTPVCQMRCSRSSRRTWAPLSLRRVFVLG